MRPTFSESSLDFFGRFCRKSTKLHGSITRASELISRGICYELAAELMASRAAACPMGISFTELFFYWNSTSFAVYWAGTGAFVQHRERVQTGWLNSWNQFMGRRGAWCSAHTMGCIYGNLPKKRKQSPTLVLCIVFSYLFVRVLSRVPSVRVPIRTASHVLENTILPEPWGAGGRSQSLPSPAACPCLTAGLVVCAAWKVNCDCVRLAENTLWITKISRIKLKQRWERFGLKSL